VCYSKSCFPVVTSLRRRTRKPLSLGLMATILLATLFGGASSQTEEPTPFRTQRLSEKVLLLTEISPMENIVVALATELGLVVVDATGSPHTAGLLRKVIEEEFGRDDFAYLLQTHYHWDHAWGNAAFPEAKVVAHEAARDLVDADRARLPEILSRRRQHLRDLEGELAALDVASQERETLEERRDFQNRNVRGMEGGFDIRTPDILFSDRLELDLGDMTLHLTFFGRAHSGNDVLIQVPEEEILLTGDLFLDIGWLPLFAGQPVLDIPRWIDVLAGALDGEDRVSTIVPGHREAWNREKFELWRGYIVDLWEEVNIAKAEGATLEDVVQRFPLDRRFYYLTDLGHTEDALVSFQRQNVEAFWRQISR